MSPRVLTSRFDRFCRTMLKKNLPAGQALKIYSEDWFPLMYDMALRAPGLQKPGLFKNRILVEVRTFILDDDVY